MSGPGPSHNSVQAMVRGIFLGRFLGMRPVTGAHRLGNSITTTTTMLWRQPGGLREGGLD